MANDLWETPPEVMKFLEVQFHFVPTIDGCASRKNKKAPKFYSEKNSFLDVEAKKITGEKIWCNPPYSKPLPFVKKCIELSQNNNEVFMLLNMDTSTAWFMEVDATDNATAMPLTGGRIAFVENGKRRKGNDRAQLFIRFSPVKQKHGQASWQTICHAEIMEYKED